MQCVCDIRVILWDLLYILLSLTPSLYEGRLSSLFLKKVKLSHTLKNLRLRGESPLYLARVSICFCICWVLCSPFVKPLWVVGIVRIFSPISRHVVAELVGLGEVYNVVYSAGWSDKRSGVDGRQAMISTYTNRHIYLSIYLSRPSKWSARSACRLVTHCALKRVAVISCLTKAWLDQKIDGLPRILVNLSRNQMVRPACCQTFCLSATWEEEEPDRGIWPLFKGELSLKYIGMEVLGLGVHPRGSGDEYYPPRRMES